MNITQTTAKNSLMSESYFSGTLAPTDYLWKNITIEKSVSKNLLYRMYKGSLLEAFWLVFTSPVN
jgi:hypothetical protein